MECYCYLRNVQNLLAGRTPHERRFGEPLKGPVIPFGTMVEYYPTSARDKSRLHQNGKKVLPGKSLGFAMIAGRIWKGDVLVADIEELEKMDASETYPRRINAKEVMTPQREGYFIFPIADGKRPRIPRTKTSVENFMANRKGLNRQKQKMTPKPGKTR